MRASLRIGLLITFAALGTEICAQTISGAGTRDCSGLLTAAELESAEGVDAYLSWGQGFISGFNWSNTAGVEVRIDHAGLLHWLLAYCTSNPGTPFYEAMQEAVNRHAR